MFFLVFGSFAFLLFFIYDINSMNKNNKFLHHCFSLGCLIILISTICLFVNSFFLEKIITLSGILFSCLSLFSLILLIYTLFFALPFDATYVKSQVLPRVCDVKIYALCRHPGVIFFFFFYLFSAIALESLSIFWAAVIWSFFNILYVVYQDKVTFMIKFIDYHEYKKSTPFLIPNKKSIRRCIDTWKHVNIQ